jgi:hypothetical protein
MRAVAIVPALMSTALMAPAAAQQPQGPQNSVYFELFGNGGLFSINYERHLTERSNVRVGYGHWTIEGLWIDEKTTVTTVPVGASWLLGSARRLELGVGVVTGRRSQPVFLSDDSRTYSFASMTGVIGYRYQPAQSGWMFRASFTPFYGFGDEDEAYPDRGFFPSLGISGGYSF